MQEYRKPKAVVFVGRIMLAIASTVWPLTAQMAYAQAVAQFPVQQQQEDDTASWLVAQLTADEQSEQNLINKRASRLLRGETNNATLRTPNLQEDTTLPTRAPDLSVDPNDAQRAQAQANRSVKPLTQQEMVQGAQRANDAGLTFMNRVEPPVVDMQRAEPGVNQTGEGRINVTEMLPGYNPNTTEGQKTLGQQFYDNPEMLKGWSEQNRRNLRRDGCRKTQFVLQERQNIDLAPGTPANRILKVEFFDIQKQPIAGTNPVEYQTVMVPSTYKRGTVNMLVPTLGGSATVYWDNVDETFAIKYTYTPFSAPKNRNYFTYNHWFAIDRGAGPERVYSPGLVSYGGPSDGWKPVATNYIQPGVRAAYLSADLYQSQTTYWEETPGVPCEPDPPPQCEVPSQGGDSIRWCPGALGANIVLMYDDQANPDERVAGRKYNELAASNAARKSYTGDPLIRAGVNRGLNAGSSAIAQELVGSCRRDAISQIQIQRGGTYGVPNMRLCSETLVNPYPQGCKNIKRSFGLAYIGEHNFLTVRAFNKVKVPIMDPIKHEQVKDQDGFPLYTYSKEPANVTGPVRTDFTIMGGAMCPGGAGCSTEKLPDDPRGSSEGYYIEYTHTPMGGVVDQYAFDGVYVQGGGTGNFTNYGKPSEAWLPTGTAEGDGTLHQLRLMAKAYSVPINTFAGCEKYMQYVADGFCRDGKLTCVDSAPTRTVGDVTFGPGLPNSGIVDLLKKWGTDASAQHDAIDNGAGADPTPNGPPVVLLEDKMCWEAEGESFTSCATMQDDGSLRHYFKEDKSEWATDCDQVTNDDDVPITQACKPSPQNNSCDSRFNGIFTGTCYNPTIAYDCGETRQANIPVVVEEQGDACTGVIRCMGTECHRPNLSGNHGEDFARAASGMEGINFMMSEMVCAETGVAPTSPDEPCTPVVFGGKPMYCKQPIGHQIGITPDCCKEARKGAASGPSWLDYLQAAKALYKISRTATVQQFLGGFDVYNHTADFFGEVAKPFTDAYDAAAGWVSDNVVKPFSAGFDNLFGDFAAGPGSTAATTAVDAGAKQGMVSGVVDQLKTKLMNSAYEILNAVSPELAQGVFVNGGTTAVAFTESAKAILENINTVFMVYSIAKLIGHIIFACKQEEFEWGMNDKWRLCTFVDSCCSKKIFLIGCIEKRQLYCCYKSIATRVMSEQIVKQNLTGNRPFGYRQGGDGRSMGGCDINCGGFTPMELASVDWSRVDLTEWTDAMVESGMINTADPRQSYGVTGDSVPISKVVGGPTADGGDIDERSAAFKTVEGWQQNKDKLVEFSETLRQDGVEHCYDPNDDKKMPFTYPGCKTQPANP